MAPRRTRFLAVLALWHLTILTSGDEGTDHQAVNDKRYIAALAKNGRLPVTTEVNQQGDQQKRQAEEPWGADDQPRDNEDADVFYFNDEDSRPRDAGPYDKRYYGAFLKSRGKPRSGQEESDEEASPDKRYVGAFLNSRGKPNLEKDEAQSTDKRYVGAFFNSRGRPNSDKEEEQQPGDKRYIGAFLNSRGKPDVDKEEDKRYLGAFLNSRGRPEPQVDKRHVGAFFNSRGRPGADKDQVQSLDKRFVGAFFNSRGRPNSDRLDGREPAGKRYVGAFLNSRGRPNTDDDPDKRFVGAVFNSRGRPEVEDEENDDEQGTDKRNIASLARKGWLSAIRSYRSPPGQRIQTPRRYSSYNDKRDDSLYSDEPRVITSDDEDCVDDPEVPALGPEVEKRNIAYLARNGMLPPRRGFSDYSLKRTRPLHIPRRWPQPSPKRQQANQIRVLKGRPRRCPPELKRNVAAMARKGLLPDKKSVAAMARKGLLPT